MFLCISVEEKEEEESKGLQGKTLMDGDGPAQKEKRHDRGKGSEESKFA